MLTNIQFQLVVCNVSYVEETESGHGFAICAVAFFGIGTLKILIILC